MAENHGPQGYSEDRTKRTKVVVPIPLGDSPIPHSGISGISALPPPRDRTEDRRRPSRSNPASQFEHHSSESDSDHGNSRNPLIFSPKQGNQSDISQPSSPQTRRANPRPTPQGLNVEDCLEYMVNFVEKCDLTKIVWRHDIEYESRLHRNELKEKLRPQAKVAAGLPARMKFVNREFMNNFAILSLYDLAVLVDDSQSMAFEEKGDRIRAMKKVLAYLAHIYGLSSKDRGISAIRFLNGNDDLKANNLKDHEIDAVVNAHEFEGLTKIGTGLMSKILKPLVFAEGQVWNKQDKKPRKLRNLKRPLLIMIITDGAVEGEPAVRLPQAIKSVHESLKAAGYTADTKAVVFQFARVGNDKNAQEYLEFLDDHSSVKELVDTMSGSDLMELIGWHGGMDSDEAELTETQQRNMIKLLLGPINSQFDKDIQAEANCDDDFDDEEEDEWESYQFSKHKGDAEVD